MICAKGEIPCLFKAVEAVLDGTSEPEIIRGQSLILGCWKLGGRFPLTGLGISETVRSAPHSFPWVHVARLPSLARLMDRLQVILPTPVGTSQASF
jgi:hypothetical protein